MICVLRVPDVARLLGVSCATVRRRIRSNRLKARVDERSLVVLESDFDKYVLSLPDANPERTSVERCAVAEIDRYRRIREGA